MKIEKSVMESPAFLGIIKRMKKKSSLSNEELVSIIRINRIGEFQTVYTRRKKYEEQNFKFIDGGYNGCWNACRLW